MKINLGIEVAGLEFFDVISCFLCNPIGPYFRESMYNDTLVALDPGLCVIGRSLRGLLNRGNL